MAFSACTETKIDSMLLLLEFVKFFWIANQSSVNKNVENFFSCNFHQIDYDLFLCVFVSQKPQCIRQMWTTITALCLGLNDLIRRTHTHIHTRSLNAAKCWCSFNFLFFQLGYHFNLVQRATMRHNIWYNLIATLWGYKRVKSFPFFMIPTKKKY